jgi:5'-3' exonuclease
LKNKPLVVDASNLLYRLNIDEELIPMLYQVLITFKYYNIIPLFVFDGEPPEEKKEKLIERRKLRVEAAEQYAVLMDGIENKHIAMNGALKNVIKQLEKTKTRLNISLINDAKCLMKSCGIPYVDAVGEADDLCAKLVNSDVAWACISEDMDLFAHGCKRIIRYFSVFQHNCVVYSLAGILSTLKMNMDDFRAVCVVCCSDYDKEDTISVDAVWYEGITKNALIDCGYVKNMEKFERTCAMFAEECEVDGEIVVGYTTENRALLRFVLENNGFVYPVK